MPILLEKRVVSAIKNFLYLKWYGLGLFFISEDIFLARLSCINKFIFFLRGWEKIVFERFRYFLTGFEAINQKFYILFVQIFHNLVQILLINALSIFCGLSYAAPRNAPIIPTHSKFSVSFQTPSIIPKLLIGVTPPYS